MSMWRTIATRIGSVFDRPDATDLPYGTQWHDPDTGNTWATDETTWYPLGSAAGVGQVGPWIGDAVTASTYDEDLTLLDGVRLVLPMCSPVNVECVVVYLSDVIVYGSVEVRLTVNGVETGEAILLSEGNCLAVDLGVYVETCDVIGFTITTSADLDPTVSVTVMARLGPPTPPDTSPGEDVHTLARHGIVLGHQVSGGSPPDIPATPFARYRASELALSNSDPVSTWADEGSGGNDLVQATGTAQPTYESAGFNGNPSVLFDGTSDWMQTALYGASDPQPHTIVVMFEYVTVSSTAVQVVCDGGTNVSSGRHAIQHRGNQTGDPWSMFAGQNLDASDTPVGKAGVDLCIVAIFNGASSEFHVNDGGNLVPATTVGSNGLWRFTLGSLFTGGSNFSNIRVVEALIYQRVLTAQEISDLQSYFGATYS